LWANPIILGLLRAILGPDLLIDNLTIVTAYPGARDQQIHRDHNFLFSEATELRGLVRPYAVTLVIPLIDLSEETGSTRLFPGTHRAETSSDNVLPIVARGDCFLMDYRLSHLGTANLSDQVRPMMFIVYARSWFTDIQNLRRQERIRITREDLAALPSAHWPLFRRLAAKGCFDVSERELFPEK
jgi:ectoine hydroxylase-related dioxygenase (phytanoyl-CoA dioxygenase family)